MKILPINQIASAKTLKTALKSAAVALPLMAVTESCSTLYHDPFCPPYPHYHYYQPVPPRPPVYYPAPHPHHHHNPHHGHGRHFHSDILNFNDTTTINANNYDYAFLPNNTESENIQ